MLRARVEVEKRNHAVPRSTKTTPDWSTCLIRRCTTTRGTNDTTSSPERTPARIRGPVPHGASTARSKQNETKKSQRVLAIRGSLGGCFGSLGSRGSRWRHRQRKVFRTNLPRVGGLVQPVGLSP